jgi:GNAT superfamily N-acetyltransferase
MSIMIRALEETDLDVITALSTQMPDASPASGIAARVRWLGQRAAHENAFFVACGEPFCTIVGFVHVHGVTLLGTIAYAEIGSLVVDHAHRRRGIGSMLVSACERWAKERAFSTMRLRPGRARAPEAHGFYRQLGYELVPPAALFHKEIGAS